MKLVRGVARIARAYGRVLRPVRGRAIGAVAVAAASGCAEALGLLALTPLLDQTDPSWKTVLPVLLLLSGSLVAATLLKLAADAIIGSVTTRVEAYNRRQLTERLIFAPWASVGRLSQGEITAAVMSESTQVSNGVFALLSGAGSLVVAVILAGAAAYVTPQLLGITALFIVAAVAVFRSRLKHVRENERRISLATTEVGEEISSALGEVKYLRESGKGRIWLLATWQNADLLARLRRRQIIIPAATRTTVDSIAAVFLSIVVGVAVLVLDDLALGLVFVALFYRLIPRVQAVQSSMNIAYGQATWIERWQNRLASLGGAAAHDTSSWAEDARVARGERAPRISISDVSHSYPSRSTPVLRGINIDISPGERVAITGESGSGKTTILDLLLGLFPPSSGRVLVNDSELDAKGWARFRREVGLVPQDVSLRKGTLADNVRDGLNVSDEEVAVALNLAQLTSLVSELGAGMHTPIDSKHIGLSGGQRQRIGLARALVRRPSLLVMDEATSALDMATERSLLDAVGRVGWEMTVVIVTHRPSALINVDRQIEIADGTVRIDRKV